MFWLYLKKVLVRLFFPMPAIGILLLVAAYLLLSKHSTERRRKVGKWLLIGTLALYYLLGVGGWLLLQPLATAYPPVDPAALNAGPYVLAVAGNTFYADPELPDDCRFGDGMGIRLLEAGRIAHQLEKNQIPYTLVVSLFHPTASAALKLQAARAFLAAFDIPPERIHLVESAANSRQEIKEFARYPGRLVIISEAWHVPRLMRLAQGQEIPDAIPAPAAVRSQEHFFTPLSLIPSAENFDDARRAVYEWLGIVEAICL